MGEKEPKEERMNPEMASKYRAMVARANYLAPDRSDIAYTTKELRRKMSDPCTEDWNKLKRLSRYLIGKERMVVMYEYQRRSRDIVVWTDTDFA